MTFGQRIKMLRQERGLSQEELGRLVGVSSRVIGYYEADERFPKNRDTLIAFASAFQVSLDYLLDNPVRSDNTCPSRFCYMKSMNSEQRNAVNQFIGYLRYRERTEADAAEEADQMNRKYGGSSLSDSLISMIENWDEDEAAEEAPDTDAAEDIISADDSTEGCEDTADEAKAAVTAEAEADAPAETAEPEPAPEPIPEEPEEAFEIDDLPGLEDRPPLSDYLPEPEAVADPEEDFARKASQQNMSRFFDSEFFVDDFFN